MIHTPNIQILVTAILSSGLVGGLLTYFTKKASSPESENSLVKIGNDFAQQLLTEARAEREELRATITALEAAALTKDEAINRLTKLAEDKDRVIERLEEQRFILARKIDQNLVITMSDLFGSVVPEEFTKPRTN